MNTSPGHPSIIVAIIFLFYAVSSFAQEADTTLARQYVEEAAALSEAGKYEPSTALYEKAVAIYEQHKLWEEFIANRKNIGVNLFKSKKIKESKAYYISLLEVSLQLLGEKHRYTAKIYKSLCVISRDLNAFDDAITFCEKSLAIEKKIVPLDYKNIANIHNKLSIYSRTIGDLEKAVEYGLAGLDFIKNIPDEEKEKAHLYNNLGSSYRQLGNYKRSLEYFQKASELYEQRSPEDENFTARAYINMSIVYMDLGDTEKSLAYRKKALAKLESAPIPDYRSLASIYNGLGIIFAKSGAYQKAHDRFEEALKINEDHLYENPRGLAMAHNNLGIVNGELKNYQEALNHLFNALEWQNSISETRIESISALSNIALVYKSLKQYVEALIYAQKAIQLGEKMLLGDHVEIGTSYNNLAAIYEDMQEYDKAAENYQEALHIYELSLPDDHYYISRTNNNLAILSYKKNKYEESLAFVHKAMAGKPEKDISGRFELLRAQQLKTEILRDLHEHDPSQHYLREAFMLCEQFDSLIGQIRNSLTEYEDRITFNERAHEMYELATEIAYLQAQQTGDPAYTKAAFSFIEKSKANSLLASINAMEALQFANIPDSILLKERQLKKAITTSETALNNLNTGKDSVQSAAVKEKLKQKETYRSFITDLENNYPDYHRLKYQLPDISITDVQHTLDKNDLLVEYLLGKEAIYILSIGKQHAKIDQFKKPEDWDQSLHSLRRAVADAAFVMNEDSTQQVFNQYTKYAHQLYQDLLKNALESSVESVQNLRIIPDGELNYIPFELLLKNKHASDNVNYQQQEYVLKDHLVSYAYSVALLMEANEKKEKTATLAYGGFAPEYSYELLTALDSTEARYKENQVYGFAMRDGLVDLPAARTGIAQIARIFEGDAFLSDEATKSVFMENAAQFNILHLAMHGLVDDVNPLYSKLVFTPEKGDRKGHLLNAADIYNMEINAELSVLSACNTGYGEIIRGEGVMSLSRAFTYAGSPSIVMSLWSVPDVQTTNIMVRFFEYLKAGKAKDEALRDAKLSHLKSSPQSKANPLFWAGFVATGNTRPLTTGQSNSARWWVVGIIGFLISLFLIIRI